MQANNFFYSNKTFELFKSKPKYTPARQGFISRQRVETGFSCTHCHLLVSCARNLSGVQNRNHCPYCLWSRHMDLKKPGDRLCECRAGMKPVGLTLKNTNKKYGDGQNGELMLIHICVKCGKTSINRIAADDDAFMIMGTFQASLKLDAILKNGFIRQGIRVLKAADWEIVNIRLFGKPINYQVSG